MSDIEQSNGLSKLLAVGLAMGAVTSALLIGKRASPTPDHPRTALWYQTLEKPEFTPPALIYPFTGTGIRTAPA